jgi:hypothetical protein
VLSLDYGNLIAVSLTPFWTLKQLIAHRILKR